MKITDARVIVTCPGRNFVNLKIVAARYPYNRACLPVNRLLDGTMWNW